MGNGEKKDAGPPNADHELIRLVDALAHWRPGKRKAAENAIRQRGTELTDSLLALFQWEREQRARNGRFTKRTLTSVLGGALACIGASWWFCSSRDPADLCLVGLLIGMPVTIVLAIFLALQHNTPRQTTTAVALSLLDDVRAVGPICEMLEFQDTSSLSVLNPRLRAVSALQRLLPLLREEHSELLDAKQRACLVRALGSGNMDAETVVRALDAYRYVGIGYELPVVRRFAGRRPWSETGRRIRDSAVACLPILEQRAEEEKHTQTLLRPSQQAADAASDVLLRAASGVSEPEPQQLLRASTSDRE